MADTLSVVTEYTNSTCPRVKVTVTVQEETPLNVTYSWVLRYVTPGDTISTPNEKTVVFKLFGKSLYTDSIVVGGKKSFTIAKGIYTVTKTQETQTMSVFVRIYWGTTKWKNEQLGTRDGTGDITVSPMPSYTVRYNANGGSGAPDAQTKWYDTPLTLSSVVPTRTGHTFSKWEVWYGTDAGTQYESGGEFTTNESVVLIAVWIANYMPPAITNIKCYRSDSSGNSPSDTDTYARLTFDWEIDSSQSNVVTTLKIERKVSGGTYSNLGTYDPEEDEFSGSETLTMSNIDIDKSYVIRITLADQNSGETTIKSVIVEKPVYTLDFAPGGNGIGVGGVAPTDRVHLYLPVTYTVGSHLDDDLNNCTTSGCFMVPSVSLSGSIANRPSGASDGFLIVRSYSTYVYQEFISPLPTGALVKYVRTKYGSTWSAWVREPRIQTGTVEITPTAKNTPTKKAVTFPVPFASAPTVTVTAATIYPGTKTTGVAVAAVTSTGCNIYLTRTDTSATTVHWQAIEAT